VTNLPSPPIVQNPAYPGFMIRVHFKVFRKSMDNLEPFYACYTLNTGHGDSRMIA